MPVTLEQVRAALAPEELDYQKVAKELGEEALPHLERLIATAQPLLASKAAYMAGVIGTASSVPAIERAARSADARVRIAAAHAVQHLPTETASDVLLSLVDDADVGVQKTALRAVPADASPVLMARVEGLSAAAAAHDVVRSSALNVLGRRAEADALAATPTPAAVAASRGVSKVAAKKASAMNVGARSAAKKGGSKKSAGKRASRSRAGSKKR